MAITEIYWPERLPSVPVVEKGDHVRFSLPENTAVFDKPDAGPPLGRPRSTAHYTPIFIPLYVKSYFEVRIFLDFYMNTLMSGTQPFIWEGWVETGPSVFRFDLSEDPPDPDPQGEGCHKIPMRLLQYPEGAV